MYCDLELGLHCSGLEGIFANLHTVIFGPSTGPEQEVITVLLRKLCKSLTILSEENHVYLLNFRGITILKYREKW